MAAELEEATLHPCTPFQFARCRYHSCCHRCSGIRWKAHYAMWWRKQDGVEAVTTSGISDNCRYVADDRFQPAQYYSSLSRDSLYIKANNSVSNHQDVGTRSNHVGEVSASSPKLHCANLDVQDTADQLRWLMFTSVSEYSSSLGRPGAQERRQLRRCTSSWSSSMWSTDTIVM